MKHKAYFPTKIAKVKTWANTYKQKIAEHGGTVGMSATDITAEQGNCDAMIGSIDESNLAKATAKQKVADCKNSIKNNMAILGPKITTHKANNGYTEGIGDALGVIGAESNIDPNTVKTVVKLVKISIGIDIKFTLEGCEGGNIYCKRGGETEFTFLKHVTHPHTVDTRPNLNGAAAEERQYYVTLVIFDEEAGVNSDIATVSH